MKLIRYVFVLICLFVFFCLFFFLNAQSQRVCSFVSTGGTKFFTEKTN